MFLLAKSWFYIFNYIYGLHKPCLIVIILPLNNILLSQQHMVDQQESKDYTEQIKIFELRYYHMMPKYMLHNQHYSWHWILILFKNTSMTMVILKIQLLEQVVKHYIIKPHSPEMHSGNPFHLPINKLNLLLHLLIQVHHSIPLLAYHNLHFHNLHHHQYYTSWLTKLHQMPVVKQKNLICVYSLCYSSPKHHLIQFLQTF